MFARDGARGDESRKPPPPPLMEKKLGRAGGVAREHEVPFDFAQGKLSTTFGCRLTSLGMTVRFFQGQ
jgi:hypothetical protein